MRDLLRPEPPRPLPSRTALIADVVFAIVLTVLALIAAARLNGGDVIIHKWVHGPVPPTPPDPPDPPSVPGDLPPPPPVPPLPGPHGPYGEFVQRTPWFLTVLTTLPLAARRRFPLLAFSW